MAAPPMLPPSYEDPPTSPISFNSTCCVERKWNPAYNHSEPEMYLYGHQDGPCFSGIFRDCSDQFRSQQHELCANATTSDDYHSMSEIQRKCEHFARGDCGTDDKNVYATFPGTPEMCAELSAQGHGPPHCETKQDCLDALPQHLGLLIDSIVWEWCTVWGYSQKLFSSL